MLIKKLNSTILLNNIININKETGKKVIGVVKSDAYGHGLRNICEILNNNVEIVMVNNVKEAMQIRSYSFKILIYTPLTKNDLFNDYCFNKLILSIYSLNDLILLKEMVKTKVVIHFHIDTGMNRGGFKSIFDFKEALKYALDNDIFIVDGIYTHFTDNKSVKKQTKIFKKYLSFYKFNIIHTGRITDYKKIKVGNFLRIGLEMYGKSEKRQTLSLYTYPLFITTMHQNEKIGYEGLYKAKENEKIALLPIGYYNGFYQCYQGFFLKANGKLFPIVGKICMNHLFVLVDDSVDLNTRFTITDATYPISNIEKHTLLSPYEIFCSFKEY